MPAAAQRRPRPPARIEFWRDAGLPMIEGRRAIDSPVCYRAHTHPTWSVGIVDAGTSTLRLGSRAFRLQAGDVVVIAPGQVHSCNPRAAGSWSYRMFYLEAHWVESVLASAAHRRWPQGVIRHAQARAAVDRIEGLLRAAGPSAGRAAVLQRQLKSLFRLCPVQVETNRLPRDDETLRAVRDYLDAHCLERAPLRHLAGMAGLSPFRLIRRFRAAFGLTPHAYQLDRRINHARLLLRTDRPLAEIAYATGFSDQSHFQRAFKPRVAATPAEFRHGRRIIPRRAR